MDRCENRDSSLPVLSAQALDIDNVEFAYQVFGPPSHDPGSESIHVTGPPCRIVLDGIRLDEWIGSEPLEDME